MVRRECAAFQEQQTDIDSRLVKVTNSDTNDETAKRFEVGMEKLRKLDVAKGYMELLYDVDSLRFAFFIALKLNLFTHSATARKL
jgi:hypothetical protein